MTGDRNGWLPIETYRKVSDKTKAILVFFPGWGVEKVSPEFTGYSSFVFGEHRVPEQPEDWPDKRKGPSKPPTHWMPLPPPPTTIG